MRAIVTVTPWKQEPIVVGIISAQHPWYSQRLGGLMSAVEEAEAHVRATGVKLVVWDTQVEWVETSL